MAVYRLENVELILQDKNVKATADLMRSANGQPPWVLVESISTTVPASKEAQEIAKAVGEFAKSIARRDNVINEVLAQAKALLEGAVVEL
jgi:hypothetical protein